VYVALLAFVHARAGAHQEARKLLREIEGSSGYLCPGYLLWIYAGLGESEQIRKWLEASVAEQVSPTMFYVIKPELNSLRAEPEFREFFLQIQLPEKLRQSDSRSAV